MIMEWTHRNRETLFSHATKWFNFGIEISIAARKTNDWAKLRFEWKVCGIRFFIWYLSIHFLFCTIKIKLTHIKKNKLRWFVVFFYKEPGKNCQGAYNVCAMGTWSHYELWYCMHYLKRFEPYQIIHVWPKLKRQYIMFFSLFRFT